MELGDLDLAAGRYAKAVSEGDRAVAMFRATGDRANEGIALTITGVAHIYAGEYPAALNDLEQALKIARDTGDRANEVTRRNNIGNVYFFEGRYTDALEQYDAAIAIVESHRDEPWNASRRQLTVANLASLYQRLGRYDRALDAYSGLRASHAALAISEQAQLLANMGSLYRRLGDPVKALETYRAAQDLYRRDKLRSGEIGVLNNIGIAQALDLGKPEEALATFDLALHMAEASGDKPLALHALLYRAETLFRIGRVSDSGNDFAGAASLAASLDAVEEQWKALYGQARIAERTGDSKLAEHLLRNAIALIESLRGYDPETLRGAFLADKRQVYDLLIRQLAREREPDVANLFRLMELSRARTLQDHRGSGASLRGVQTLLPSDTALLEYWIGEESIVVVWVTATGSGFGYRNAGPGLRARLRSFTSMLKDAGNNGWQSASETIAHDLLDGATGALANPAVGKLVIVPDREAAGIPFEVLPLPSRRIERLVDSFAVSYLPAASLLQGAAGGRSLFPFWRRTVLAFADPAPGAVRPALDFPAAHAGRLPAAVGEALDAAALIGGRAAIFKGSVAVKNNLIASLRLHFPLIHFATHAFSDPEDPSRSYILFAPAKPSQAWDYLFLKEVQALDLRGVDLVTVSACDTESGELVEGEGVAGFSHAFLRSGARAVVTSLWQVGDQATANLMRNFYRNLAGGATAADALRAAKNESLRFGAGRRQHPFYWAAFVLNGDGSVRAPLVIRWTYAASGACFIAGLAALMWNFKTKGRRASASERSRLR